MEIGQVIAKPLIILCLIFATINGVVKCMNNEKKGSWSDVVVSGLSIASLVFIGWI